MTGRVDRAFVQELLEDESLSYREIARQAGCSDWTVRSIARGDDRPMKRAGGFEGDAETTPAGWVPFVVIAAVLVALTCLGIRRVTNEGGPMP